MVDKEIAPTACSGCCSGTSRMLPLQPSHSPPFWRSASSTPAARPPAVASPSWIGATRLETTTRRDMDRGAFLVPRREAARVGGRLGGNDRGGHVGAGAWQSDEQSWLARGLSGWAYRPVDCSNWHCETLQFPSRSAPDRGLPRRFAPRNDSDPFTRLPWWR